MKHFLLFILMLIVTQVANSQKKLPLWKTMPEPPTMPQVDLSGLAPVNGIKLYYAVYNKKGAAPVILLHGDLPVRTNGGLRCCC